MKRGASVVWLLLISAASADEAARVDYSITLLDADRPRLAIEIDQWLAPGTGHCG